MAGEEVDTGAGARVPVFQELAADDPERLGAYTLVARLGAGGMGKVYLSHTPAGRPVALKAIRPELADDPEFRRRFRREVAAARRVQGLYTAPVIDSDTDGTPAWLATAYVPGPTLAAAVARFGPLPVRTVLLLAAGVAEALQAVHAAGIVHRDVKPSNVLLATDGPRVIDFGIAQAADSTSFTNTSVTVGTPVFMAPEQATGTGLGPAIDVFSLGQVVAFAAQGTPAFGEGQTHGVLYRIVHQEPDLTGVPEPLLALLHRCLAKDPAERPSPAEVIELCRAAAEDGRLARSENWLPEPVATDVGRHEAVPEQAVSEATVHGRGRGATDRAARTVRWPRPERVRRAPRADRARRPARGDRTAAVAARAFPTSTVGHSLVGGPTWWVDRPADGRSPVRSRRRGRRIAVFAWLGALALFGVWGIMSGISDPSIHDEVYRGMRLPSGSYLQFKDDPLTPTRRIDGSTPDITFDCDGWDCTFETFRSRMFPLSRSKKGSLAVCRKARSFTTTLSELGLVPGEQFCVATNAGTLALFTIREPEQEDLPNYVKEPAQEDPPNSVDLDIDVWRHAFPKDEY